MKCDECATLRNLFAIIFSEKKKMIARVMQGLRCLVTCIYVTPTVQSTTRIEL